MSCMASLVDQLVKNPPAMQEAWVLSHSWGDPLEKGKATHLVFLPGEFHGQRLQRVERDWTTFTSLSVAIYKQKLQHDFTGALHLKSMKDSDTMHHVTKQLILGTQSLR